MTKTIVELNYSIVSIAVDTVANMIKESAYWYLCGIIDSLPAGQIGTMYALQRLRKSVCDLKY